MIIQPLPQTVTTTEIQRQPKLLANLQDDEYKIVLKGGKQISVISSVPLFKQLIRGKRFHPPGKQLPKTSDMPIEIVKKLRQIKDPVAYQRKMRDE